jgi:hypothetical protein
VLQCYNGLKLLKSLTNMMLQYCYTTATMVTMAILQGFLETLREETFLLFVKKYKKYIKTLWVF